MAQKLTRKTALEKVTFSLITIFTSRIEYITYVSVYPTECTGIYPPVSIECLNAIWLNESCVVNGTNYPGTLSGSDRETLDTLDVL